MPISSWLAVTLLLVQAAPAPAQQPSAARWYKGNTHTHTLNSDGDSTPDEVVRWYRENAYNFLVLSDHNFLTAVDGLNALHGAEGKFLVIKGEEVTDRFGETPIHINGLEVERLVEPQGGATLVETVQRNVDAIRATHGVPHINHPNFGWAITTEQLQQIRNNKLFEIYNGHPLVNNLGGGGVPGLEEVWDAILSAGVLLYGIAVDDAHHFKRPWDKTAARPGQGWVMVRSDRLAPDAILAAMERGEFYASTGVELADYQVSDSAVTVTVRQEGSSKYRIQFIGRGGRVLSEATTGATQYRFRGNEGYVRARILESNGKMAWTQPVMRGGK
jgi:predicted metal-dependent phosphoesterase TrpH